MPSNKKKVVRSGSDEDGDETSRLDVVVIPLDVESLRRELGLVHLRCHRHFRASLPVVVIPLDVESLRRELGLVHLRCHRHFRASLLRQLWLVQHCCQKCHSHR